MLMLQLLFKREGWVAVATVGVVATAHAATSPERITAQVEAAARQQLQQLAEREGWREPRVEAAVVADAKPVAACAQAVEVEATDTRTPARMRFTVRCADGWKHVFVVRASVSAPVLVTATNVAPGKPIAASDVTLERRDISAVPDALADTDQVIDMTSRRSLRSGEILRKSLLAAPVLVRRGETVRVVAQREQVEVTIVGEALDAGGRGDVVRVRNGSTGKVISTRVTGAGTVVPSEMWVPMPSSQSRD
jgi:flagella basal body P-ring formation protein FlgA